MLIMLGATATFTFSHWSGRELFMAASMAELSTAIPVGWATSADPKYWALSTFFGSSIGVGKDWAESKILEI